MAPGGEAARPMAMTAHEHYVCGLKHLDSAATTWDQIYGESYGPSRIGALDAVEHHRAMAIAHLLASQVPEPGWRGGRGARPSEAP